MCPEQNRRLACWLVDITLAFALELADPAPKADPLATDGGLVSTIVPVDWFILFIDPVAKADVAAKGPVAADPVAERCHRRFTGRAAADANC